MTVKLWDSSGRVAPFFVRCNGRQIWLDKGKVTIFFYTVLIVARRRHQSQTVQNFLCYFHQIQAPVLTRHGQRQDPKTILKSTHLVQ